MLFVSIMSPVCPMSCEYNYCMVGFLTVLSVGKAGSFCVFVENNIF